MKQLQYEFDFVVSRINVPFKELWRQSYATAKLHTPARLQGETMEQYYRDLGISTLFEFSENIRLKALEMTRLAMEEDIYDSKKARKEKHD